MNSVLERARRLRDDMPRLIQPSQADFDRVRMLTEIETLQAEKKQARADALREAAGIAASWHDSADCDPCDCLKAVSANILALIDQPQEDVCEHNWQKVSDRDWYQINGEGPLYPGPPGKCPYCGKPIKVKE